MIPARLTCPPTLWPARAPQCDQAASPFQTDRSLTRSQLEYRLSVCPELSLGVFCTVIPSFAEKHEFEISTLPVANAVEGGRDDGAVSVLLAHIIATKFEATSVSDKDMEYPCDFKTVKTSTSDVGHVDAGRTVALHSIAVHPKLHGCGLGKLIMKAYMQQVKNSGIADRISLLAQEVRKQHDSCDQGGSANAD